MKLITMMNLPETESIMAHIIVKIKPEY